jgi:hypothetical protein
MADRGVSVAGFKRTHSHIGTEIRVRTPHGVFDRESWAIRENLNLATFCGGIEGMTDLK